MNTQDRIKLLMDEYRVLEQSDENRRRRSMWKEIAKSGRDQFRATPLMDYSWKDGKVPIIADIQNPTWAMMFDFDLSKFYTDAPTFVENYLKIMIFRFKNFHDDVFLDKWLPMWGTAALEGSIFGMNYGLSKTLDPWLSHKAVIEDEDDIKRFRDDLPGFNSGEIMPKLLQCYEQSRELVDDDFEVLFPEWIRSIFGVCTYIRGYEDLLVDIATESEMAEDLLSMVTDARKNWYNGFAAYTGVPVGKANLYNDEINCPSISPNIYNNVILPIEKDLSAFHGGIHYWHSCGNVTQFTSGVRQIPNLDLFNCGPWTDIYEAGAAFKDICPIEVCMNPQADILEGTPETMRAKVKGVIAACQKSDINGFCMKISALNMYKSLDYTVDQIKLWVSIATDVIGQIRPSL